METIERDLDLTEIINGEEIMGPSPFGRHQKIAKKLNRAIDRYVEVKDLGELFFSPLDVILEEGMTRLQPDLFFIRKENMDIFQDWVRGVPDMVCEIVSPGTYKKDTDTKKEIYEKYGVPEYWIVLPEFKAIKILTIENEAPHKYKTHSFAELEGIVTSKVIEGLQIDVKDIFG
ncbi:MAG: Uma2 family endonuclease [Nitrospirae bacterium]|nr:Uma2 family endonuclease [Nitrospirota bacterium]